MTKKGILQIPPRLSMDAYAEFVSENWQNANRAQLIRQKAIEERIEKPFRMVEFQAQGTAEGDLDVIITPLE